MKVVMLGASGSGKSTLAKAIAENTNKLQYIENSAGLILTKQAKDKLAQYGYDGNLGQKGVINKSHMMVDFGVDFQNWVLISRTELLKANDNIVLDRSPLDPAVFWMSQVASNVSQQATEQFIRNCFDAVFESGVTHIIKVNLDNPEQTIEDNGSRVSNWWYQKKIDLIADFIIGEFNNYKNLHIRDKVDPRPYRVRVDYTRTWNFEARLEQALHFIK